MKPGRADRARPMLPGFTIVELMMVFAIISIIAAIAVPRYQQYTYRAQAAAVAVQAEPIRRAIQERYSTMDSNYRLELSNAADGSIAGCQAPRGGGSCTGPNETIVTTDKLLIAKDTVRVLAGLCQVDCPSYALAFTSDLASAGGVNPSAAGSAPSTPASAPSTPASSTPSTGGGDPSTAGTPASGQQGKGGGGQGKGGGGQGKGGGKGGGGSSYFPLISSAYAQSAASGLGGTNRVLYEFGELMRARVHASNNAECLHATGTCTVTIKYP